MSLRERLRWSGDGAVHDGPRRYLVMRPDVLMGAAARLDGPGRAAWLAAMADSARQQGGDSLRAYRQAGATETASLLATTEAAAADLGWGRWTLTLAGDALHLQVMHSPFAAGWRAAAGRAAPEPVCAPIQGLLAALADCVFGDACTIVEHHCSAVHGDGRAGNGAPCQFSARRA
ncbi:hypothetical protein [Pseudorhodoferax sp.]|uniref:hypothetical protein n=1 Tax=Pseudorhodoferax sp. TaxID=1993553 RepID=UPI002DD6B44C|nr:hypothetical protein [Pseudorhodoferax sp.]